MTQRHGTNQYSARQGAPSAGRYISIFLVVIAVVLACFIGSISLAGSSLLENGLFPAGTTVDGIDIGGLTYGQGKAAIDTARQADLSEIQIELDYAGNLISLSAADLSISYNVDEALDTLHYTSSEDNSLLYALQTALLPKAAGHVETRLTYDRAQIEESVRNALTPYDIEPQQKQSSSTQGTASVAYYEGTAGREARIDLTTEAILSQIESGEYAIIQVEYDIILLDNDAGGDASQASGQPASPQVDAVLLSEYTTEVTANDARNTNIRLMCEAVDGYVLAPGQVLSLNELVGERTEEKGFMYAPAIVDGSIVDDMGGGICQLAGTLYYAALLADMEVVERVRHTYPSSYLPVGLDSALNWNDKDLKLKNSSDGDITIGATLDLDAMLVTVTIYGQPLEEGTRIEIFSDVIREVPAAADVIEYTDTLPEGERQVTQAAQAGYEVKVFRNYYLNEELTKSELLSHDIYGTRGATILVGTGNNT